MTEQEDQISTVQLPELPLQKFYDTELLEVPEPAGQLLETYSKIPHDEVLQHIHQVRDRAWKVYPYPCIGHYRFLELQMKKSPAYPEILARVQKGEQLLDVGCCLGQELRQLTVDGAKSENLYGTDIHSDFFDIGYDLFRDKNTFNGLFLASDFFDHDSVVWQLKGKVDIIWTSNMLHLFSWDKQVAAVTAMLKILRRSPDSMIAGRLMGNSSPNEFSVKVGEDTLTSYRHDIQSFKKMFHTACDNVGEKWETDVEMSELHETLKLKSDSRTAPPGTMEITFVARKLARIDMSTSHNFNF